jgi:hypothetical protein
MNTKKKNSEKSHVEHCQYLVSFWKLWRVFQYLIKFFIWYLELDIWTFSSNCRLIFCVFFFNSEKILGFWNNFLFEFVTNLSLPIFKKNFNIILSSSDLIFSGTYTKPTWFTYFPISVWCISFTFGLLTWYF